MNQTKPINIDTLQPGRELDALVAERFFGARWMMHPLSSKGCEYLIDGEKFRTPYLGMRISTGEFVEFSALPRYSTDMGAAWAIVEKLQSLGFYVSISKPPDMVTWDVRGWIDENYTRRFIGHAETAPHAICLAALDTDIGL
jgi:hypothetical protein